MKDNILKKEFAKKDVQRLRNVLKGKAGERIRPFPRRPRHQG